MAKSLLLKPLHHLLLIIFLGVLGYANTLNVPFQFDDVPNIVNNPIIKDLNYYLTPAKAQKYPGQREYPMLVNRYIGSLTFALNYKVGGLDVTGYHLVNLLIHLGNALLVYWFIQLIFTSLKAGAGGHPSPLGKDGETIALFAALLFVTHPIQTQAVTYIVQRFASLATLFYLLAMSMYFKSRLTFTETSGKDGGKISRGCLTYYLAALLATVLAMKTKEIAFTLPAMIVLAEFLFFKGEIKNRISYLLPFMLTMLIIPLTLTFIADLGGSVGTATRLVTDMTRADYLFTEFRVIITYIRLIFFPVKQNIDYDYPVYHSILAPEVFWSFTALLLISLTVLYSFWRYRQSQPLTRVILFGIAWFFVTLSIESSVIPIVDVIFEHRIYLPSFGIFLAVGTLLVLIMGQCRQKWLQTAVCTAFVVTVMILTGATYARNIVWNDGIVFWQDVINKSPGKSRGYNSLGRAYATKGENLKAIESYRKAISLDPYRYDAHANLGDCLDKVGRVSEAINEYRTALRLKPDLLEVNYKLGMLYDQVGRTDEAINQFKIVLQREPDMVEAHNNLGVLFGRLGLTNEAIIEFRKALQLKPEAIEIKNNLAIALTKQQKTP